MTRFRKKPIEIDAIKWTGKNHREMYDFLEESTGKPLEAQGKYFYLDFDKVVGGLMLKTLEGEHIASIGDFIIKGISGEYYPCKPDIFYKSYDLVK